MNDTLLWLMLMFLTSAISGVFGIMVTYILMGRKVIQTVA